MAISIKNDEADRLAREVSEITGESLTTAILVALRERLQRLRQPSTTLSLTDDIMRIGKRCSALPVRDDRSPDEIIDYDEHGLPR
jgi:antitoxin VapB